MKTLANKEKVAILLNHLEWKGNRTAFSIIQGIEFKTLKRSKIKILYNRLCREMFFHNGEPQNASCAVVINETFLDELSVYYHSPHSIISQICNLLPICLNCPLTSYSIIWTNDNFERHAGPPLEIHSDYTLFETLGYTSGITDQIHKHLAVINRAYDDKAYYLDEKRLEEIKLCYSYFSTTKSMRVLNAFNFFFSAWRSHQMEHTCINLAIVFESLFSPSGRDELTHRIAFNASHFLGRNKNEKESIFDLVKRFYSLRSTIIHGGVTKHQELNVLTGVVYLLCAESLRILGTDVSVASKFESEESRNAWFKSWLF